MPCSRLWKSRLGFGNGADNGKYKRHLLHRPVPRQKDKVYLDINMKPYFPAKNFMIKMDGQKGDDGTDWNSEYNQSK